MPAATSGTDLIAVTEAEFARLAALLDKVPGELAMRKDDEDISIKDVIAHRAHWIDLSLGWYRDGQAGRDVAFPAPGYKWDDLKRYNADLRARQADSGWPEARSALDAAHEGLMAFLDGLDDAALYGGPMKGADNTWTTGRWAEAAGPSHYRSAAKYLCKRLRAG